MIKLIEPTAEHIVEVDRLFEVVVADTFAKEGLPDARDFIDEEVAFKKQQLRDYIEKKDACYLIAIKEETIVGTIWYGQAGELIAEGSNGSISELGELGTVFVLPEYQGQGIGRALINEMLELLTGKGISRCTLDSGYTHAQAVWQHKFGEPAFVMKDQWGEGIHHMIWVIDIK